MRRFHYLFIILFFIHHVNAAQVKERKDIITIQLEPGEQWWGGTVADGHKAPYGNFKYELNLLGNNRSNQAQPLLISSHGRYVWSEQPFAFSFANGQLKIDHTYAAVITGKAGRTLADAYQWVSKHYFPASGKMPDSLLFERPQWNTWIELTYHQNQKDILNYAHGIISHGFSPGVLMIDDTWQDDYGVWEFHSGRFPDPKLMMDSLHRMGFKVMLWVCPFVSADSPPYRELKDKNVFLKNRTVPVIQTYGNEKNDPAIIHWWNGASALLDFTNPAAVNWFAAQLTRLQQVYGVDGFKFDAGDANFYPLTTLASQPVLPNAHTELYAKIGLQYPLNEYRAAWKTAGQPLAQRLLDKYHTWEDLQKLVPQVMAQGLMGYAFTCPDMIGGGDFTSFQPGSHIDQDLVVRSSQCHALMPMMQFSVAPWRVLDSTHLNAVKQAVSLRQKFIPLIMQLVHQAAQTNVPVVRPMEFVFPDQGFAMVKDQFVLGDQLIVAPQLTRETFRQVLLPKGDWQADDGKIYKGPCKATLQVPLSRLPYFKKIN